MLAKPEGLCTRVLKAKYGRGADLFTESRVKKHDSLLWKNLTEVWPDITKDVGWEVRSGENVKFWMDRWLDDRERLAEYCIDSDYTIDVHLRVNQVLGRDGDWDWSWLEGKVPSNIIQVIKTIPPPCIEDGEDRVVWRGGRRGDFSVAQLYHRRRRDVDEPREEIWPYVWKLKTTRRIQVFLWLAVQDRLLTNSRKSRIIGGTSICGRCREGVEDRDHALRSCLESCKLWEALGATKVLPHFFTVPINDWFLDNLAKSDEWSIIFAVCCWMTWNWRNRLLFEDGFTMPNRPDFIIRKHVDECLTITRMYDDLGLRKYPKEVKWCFPSEGWVKLNFNGTTKGCLGEASYGGVLRKANGGWIGGYSVKLGRCNAFMAEIWGVVHGMKWHKTWVFPRLWLREIQSRSFSYYKKLGLMVNLTIGSLTHG